MEIKTTRSRDAGNARAVPPAAAARTARRKAARKAGMSDAMFAELMAVTGMANQTNRLAAGYRVEIDKEFL